MNQLQTVQGALYEAAEYCSAVFLAEATLFLCCCLGEGPLLLLYQISSSHKTQASPSRETTLKQSSTLPDVVGTSGLLVATPGLLQLPSGSCLGHICVLSTSPAPS
jgi:hypothetical protein